MRIVNMALAAALSVFAIASCGSRTGKKNTSEPAAETKAAQETETCITAIDRYLSDVIGSQYAPGEVCIPSHRIIAVDESNPQDIQVWGDFWVDNFKVAGDTLMAVSGGSHPGKMHIIKDSEGHLTVTAFEAVSDGMNTIVGERVFINMDASSRTRVASPSAMVQWWLRAPLPPPRILLREVPADAYASRGRRSREDRGQGGARRTECPHPQEGKGGWAASLLFCAKMS